jgi:hypothetical protein
VIALLYPGHQGDDHERCLDRILDGRHAEVLAERRRGVDASPLARWLIAWVGRPRGMLVAAGKAP